MVVMSIECEQHLGGKLLSLRVVEKHYSDIRRVKVGTLGGKEDCHRSRYIIFLRKLSSVHLTRTPFTRIVTGQKS